MEGACMSMITITYLIILGIHLDDLIMATSSSRRRLRLNPTLHHLVVDRGHPHRHRPKAQMHGRVVVQSYI